MKKRITYTTKYVIMVCLFLLIVTILLGYFLTKQSSIALREMIENRMLDISNTAADMLDGDALAVVQAEDEDTPAYQTILRTLKYYQDNIDLKYIYCIRDMGDSNFVFTVDPAEDPGEFGEPIVYTDALYSASKGTPAVDKEPYEDRWGRFYSAYSPVFDSKHNVAGIVAVDFSAEWYEQQITKQVRTTMLISGLSLVFAAIAIFLSLARYRRRFQMMVNEMNVISSRIETLICEVAPGTDVSRWEEARKEQSSDEVAELSNQIFTLEKHLSEQITFIRSQAYVDSLTGLGNRTVYEDHVKQLDDDIKNGEVRFALAVFDLNGLKEMNDRYGHEKGDQAIIELGSILKKAFNGEKIYRIGGDEFVIIFDGYDSYPKSQMDAVDSMLSKTDDIAVAKGCAIFTPGEDTAYHEVFRRADVAMYEDKKKYYMSHGDRRRRR